MPKRVKVGDVELDVMEGVPRPEDHFMCSRCLATFEVRDLTVVPSFDQERGWSGAYRCPADEAAAFEEARSAILWGGLGEAQLADFLVTLDRWNVPPAALRPFTDGEALEVALLTILDLLQRRVVRLNHGFVQPTDGTRLVVLAVDALLACLVAPRGHTVDVTLLPTLKAGEARAVLLDFAVRWAMCAVRPGDTLDKERWAELLTHSDMKRATTDAPPGDPSPEEIAHWRAVVDGVD